MENKYFNEITTLLEHAHPKLGMKHQLEFKNCFGALAGYVSGHIFISCGKFGVALKLPKEVLDDLFKQEGVKHLKYFSKGHVKKEYAVLPRRILENKSRLKKLIDESIQFVKRN
jgi:TfoX/Sxy family transcriptional regulator of competence genes